MKLTLVERLAAVAAAASLTLLQLDAVVALADTPPTRAAGSLAHGGPPCTAVRPG
jgi:hypothetical protein